MISTFTPASSVLVYIWPLQESEETHTVLSHQGCPVSLVVRRFFDWLSPSQAAGSVGTAWHSKVSLLGQMLGECQGET